MSNILIEAKGIKKAFKSNNKEKVEVLKGVDIAIEKGELLCIMGPSGVGKTTLLYILSTLELPDTGKVLYKFNGELIEVQNKKNDELALIRNKRIGFVFQFHHLLPEFSAVENVALTLLIGGVKEKEALMKAKKLLVDLELGHRLDSRPSELSGGEQQRVAIARAIINNPDVVFADEPTGNLDTNSAKNVLELILNLQRQNGITFVIATHSSEVASIANRTAHMIDGKIIEITRKS